jgi:hypothetical protein
MSYTIVVSVIVEAENAQDAYNKTLLAMDEACKVSGVSYETTDEWYDHYGEQLVEDEVNEAVLKSYEDNQLEYSIDEEYELSGGVPLTYEEKSRGWYITKRDGRWIKTCDFMPND